MDVVLMLLITSAREAGCWRNWPIIGRMLGRTLGLTDANWLTVAGCIGSVDASRESKMAKGKRERADER